MLIPMIGGPKDGEKVDVELEQGRFCVKSEGSIHFYDIMPISGETKIFYVLAFNGVSGNEVIEALISHYHPTHQ